MVARKDVAPQGRARWGSGFLCEVSGFVVVLFLQRGEQRERDTV